MSGRTSKTHKAARLDPDLIEYVDNQFDSGENGPTWSEKLRRIIIQHRDHHQRTIFLRGLLQIPLLTWLESCDTLPDDLEEALDDDEFRDTVDRPLSEILGGVVEDAPKGVQELLG